jgi:hypothetical protein
MTPLFVSWLLYIFIASFSLTIAVLFVDFELVRVTLALFALLCIGLAREVSRLEKRMGSDV